MDLPSAPGGHLAGEDLIDAALLGAASTVEQLAGRADELVRSMDDHSALLAKPLGSLREAPELLASFGLLLRKLAPLPGMRVLDFGAGSAWTTHFLAQLGCEVVALDVSPTMLELGRRRFEQQPLFGDAPEPRWSVFDGHHVDLGEASVDRILCFDALHHVPNQDEVLAEMGRVLRPGGLAGFSEPGPRHSRYPESQHEMRRYGVPEFDLVVEDVWRAARTAGFVELSLAVFSPVAQWVAPEEFAAFVRGVEHGREPVYREPVYREPLRRGPVRRVARLLRRYPGTATVRASLHAVDHLRTVLDNRRMFVMRKAGNEVTDSREALGLAAELVVEDLRVEPGPCTVVRGSCRVRNTGRNRWLPSSAGRGAVRLGLRLGEGAHPSVDHARVPLPGNLSVEPGQSVVVPFATEIRTAPPGEQLLRLELDLVAEGVTWFAELQGRPVEIPVAPWRPAHP